MSTVVFNPATPKRIFTFVFSSFLIISARFGQDARARPWEEASCTLALSFEHPSTTPDLT